MNSLNPLYSPPALRERTSRYEYFSNYTYMSAAVYSTFSNYHFYLHIGLVFRKALDHDSRISRIFVELDQGRQHWFSCAGDSSF